MIGAIQLWAIRHGGDPPSANEWRYAGPENPPQTAVARFGRGPRTAVFDTWNEAILAAGFEPRSRGTQPAAAKLARKISWQELGRWNEKERRWKRR